MTRFKHALAALTLLIFSSVSAIAVNITGTVKDASTTEPLMEATVRLLAQKDSTFIKGVTTSIDGKFTLKGVKAGDYILSITYIGYSDYNQNLKVASSNVRLGVIEMKEASHLLGVVNVVATKTPIKVMEDTVEYNADSYHTQPNAVVEDLLKRLPGVEVDSDGKITANGKSVTKFLVEGKEFFSDDPQVASKNLPVNMIDKLQVVDRKSDMARLTGVDDGEEETVINLTFKPGMNNGWFGNAQAGYGTDDRYSASFNVNRFWDGNQITFLGNLNNINQMGFSDSNGSRFNGPRGSGGSVTSRAAGVNFNVGNEEILRVGGDIIFTNTDRTSTRRQERQYIFTDYNTFSKINSLNRDRSNNVSANLRLQWKPDSFNTLEFRPQFSYNHQDAYSTELSINSDPRYAGQGITMEDNTYGNDVVSRTDNNVNSKGNSYEFSGRLIYSHNFKSHRGRSFSVSGTYRMSNVRENQFSLSHIMRAMLEDAEEDLNDSPATDNYLLEINDRYINNHTWNNRVQGRLTWTEPLGNVVNGNFLVFSYSMDYRWNNADRLTYNISDYDLDIFPPIGLTPDSTLSRSFRNDYFNQDIRFGFKKTSKTINYEAGLSLVPQMNKSFDLINSDRNIDTRWVWNYAPYLRFRYKFSKQRSFQANYNGRSSQPSMTQLQPVPDVTDPMNIKVGNPDLKPSFAHNLNIRFNDFNQEAQRSMMFNLDLSMTQNSIISKTTYDATAARTTTYTNVNGVWSARLGNMLSMPFRNKKWSFSNRIFGNASQSVGYNNGVRNKARDYQVFESPGIAFRPDNFEVELRPQYRLQLSNNSVQKQSNRTIHAYGGRFDASYYTSWGLTIQTDINYTANKGYSAGYNTNSLMWNASISQQLLRNKALTVQVRVYDLLNQVNNIRRSITANYIDDTESNSLTRYFMVSLSYRFNTFGKGNEPKSREGFGGPGGPGGRGGFGGGRPGGGGRRF